MLYTIHRTVFRCNRIISIRILVFGHGAWLTPLYSLRRVRQHRCPSAAREEGVLALEPLKVKLNIYESEELFWLVRSVK